MITCPETIMTPSDITPTLAFSIRHQYLLHILSVIEVVDANKTHLPFYHYIINSKHESALRNNTMKALLNIMSAIVLPEKAQNSLFFLPNREGLPVLWKSHIFKVKQTTIRFE